MFRNVNHEEMYIMMEKPIRKCQKSRGMKKVYSNEELKKNRPISIEH